MTTAFSSFRKYVVPFVSSGAHVLEIAPDSDPFNLPATGIRSSDMVNGRSRASQVTHTAIVCGGRVARRHSPTRCSLSMRFPRQMERLTSCFRETSSSTCEDRGSGCKSSRKFVRPGGVVATITPVSWPYHEAPIDCYRIFPEGMRTLCEDAGLTVELALFKSLEFTTAHVVSRQDVQRRQRSPGARTEPRETIGWMAADNRVRQRCDRPETRGDQDDVAGSWWGHVRVFSPPDALCSHTFRTVKPREAAPPME